MLIERRFRDAIALGANREAQMMQWIPGVHRFDEQDASLKRGIANASHALF